MPAAVLIPLIAAGATAAGTVVAAKMSSGGVSDAAKSTSDAATKAAQLQKESSDAALAFQKQQAEAAYQSSVATSKANYGQWSAHQRQLGSVGQALGLAPREIPAFETPPDPNLAPGIGTPAGSGQPGGTPGAPLTPSVGQALNGGGTTAPGPVDGSPASISAFFKSKGVSDHETPYWVEKWPELVARGQQLGDPAYPMKRLSAAEVFGGATAAPPAAPTAPVMGSVGSYLTPTPTPVTPALRMPGSVGSYL